MKVTPDITYKDLTRIITILFIIIFFLLALLSFSVLKSKRPPLVYLYTDKGDLARINTTEEFRVTKNVVNLMITLLSRHLNPDDSHDIIENLNTISSYMSGDARKKLKEEFPDSRWQEIINLNQFTETKIDMESIEYKPKGENLIQGSVICTRFITNFKTKQLIKKKILRYDFVFELLPNSSTNYPLALRINDYNYIELNQ